jgi:4-aminobutyrate--pyruvate transaminase
MKLIWYRSNALGQPQKKKIISRMRGYHGVTIASASLTGLPNNHRSFDLPIANVLHTSSPHFYKEGRPGESEEDFATRLAEDLETLIQAEGPDTIAAMFGEPVMGAGGVVVPPRTYWQKIQAVLQKYDILLVADEVICGFGRTGNMFGSTTFGMKPDMIVLSKQISSAYLPLSALLLNEKMFGPIADESNRIGTLGHGFTGGGHPVAAAVALETIKIIEERGLVAHAAEMGQRLQSGLRAYKDHPLIGEVRGVGLIAAIELVTDKTTKKALDPVGKLGMTVNGLMQKNGVITRAMGDALAFCPPLIVSAAEIDLILEALGKSLDEAAKAVL